MWERGLIAKLRLISKFMISQPGLQTITMHILPNINIAQVKTIGE